LIIRISDGCDTEQKINTQCLKKIEQERMVLVGLIFFVTIISKVFYTNKRQIFVKSNMQRGLHQSIEKSTETS